MAAENKGTTALVLGGGGITGIAWELGILAGLASQNLDVTQADLIVGTSAGSSVGAQISSGTPIADLWAAQLAPVPPPGEGASQFDTSALEAILAELIMSGLTEPQAIRARVGALALQASTPPEAAFLAAIAAGLPVHEWPQCKLILTAVDTASGEPRFFDRESGVPLVQAVAASCAVPGVFPAITIGGHRYTDGGLRSLTNADLAAGYSRVLIIAPSGLTPPTPLGPGVAGEVLALEQGGSRVLAIFPHEAAVAAIGPNVLDATRRAAAAEAGKAQGETLSSSVSELWFGD